MNTIPIRDSESPAPRPSRRGRPPGPRRVVVQLREKSNGKTVNTVSFTFDCQFFAAMKIVQEAFAGFRQCRGESESHAAFVKHVQLNLMPSSGRKDSSDASR
jgi:hypothetical protein